MAGKRRGGVGDLDKARRRLRVEPETWRALSVIGLPFHRLGTGCLPVVSFG